MQDRISTITEAGNLVEVSVSELSLRLKRTVEDAYGWVRVRGEVSGCKMAASGHLYLTLKDADSCLDVVCWRGSAAKLRFRPQDGLEVVCTGRLTTFPSRSRYQLVAERMEPAGIGALMALLDERRRRLAAEGLFDAARKRPLPYLPEVIGVVTSPTGAVIRDILHRLGERFPRRVLLWPVLVQGEQAAAQVAAAIAGFNRLPEGGSPPRPDLLIVARGGGSLEDLWAFNEEEVVRAVAASTIPLISAVGHETDTTLIDFVSDRRAPTPTAAAEIAVPVRRELIANLAEHHRRLDACLLRHIERRRERLGDLARGLRDPRRLLEAAAQRLDDLSARLSTALGTGLERRRTRLRHLDVQLKPAVLAREIAQLRRHLGQSAERLAGALAALRRQHLDRGRRRQGELARSGRALDLAYRQMLQLRGQRLQAAAALLESLSYAKVLDRGFAVVRGLGGQPVASAAEARPGLGIEIEFRDGRVLGRIDGATRRPGRPGPGDSEDQGNLL